MRIPDHYTDYECPGSVNKMIRITSPLSHTNQNPRSLTNKQHQNEKMFGCKMFGLKTNLQQKHEINEEIMRKQWGKHINEKVQTAHREVFGYRDGESHLMGHMRFHLTMISAFSVKIPMPKRRFDLLCAKYLHEKWCVKAFIPFPMPFDLPLNFLLSNMRCWPNRLTRLL